MSIKKGDYIKHATKEFRGLGLVLEEEETKYHIFFSDQKPNFGFRKDKVNETFKVLNPTQEEAQELQAKMFLSSQKLKVRGRHVPFFQVEEFIPELSESQLKKLISQLDFEERVTNPKIEEFCDDLIKAIQEQRTLLADPRKPKILSEDLNLNWDMFVAKIYDRESVEKIQGRRLLLQYLESVQCAKMPFHKWSKPDRQAFAGTFHSDLELDNEPFHPRHFGSMLGAGRFKNRINENDIHLSEAYNAIPSTGLVSEQHFFQAHKSFVKAFECFGSGAGLAVFTRFIAMKRPDVFVCTSNHNIHGLFNALSITNPPSIESYWSQLIPRLHQTPPKPDSERQIWIWKARTTMVDSLFYWE